MVVTRSVSQKADTENAVRDKVTERPSKEITAQRAQVTNAKSGTSQQQVDAENSFRCGNRFVKHKSVGKLKMIVARPRSSGKYYDLDERTLAMGIFIDTLKEERLKNDPDFAFTREFYRAAMHDFNSLNDDNKAMYIAEAKKRNTIEDNAVAARKVVGKSSNMNFYDNMVLEGKAVRLYNNAMKAERLKNTGESYGARQDYYVDLNDDDRAPYLAEATARLLDERVEALKKADEFGVHGYTGL